MSGPDVADLARLDEEMAPLQARLDELNREYNRLCDAINEQTLADLDLSEVRARTGGALRKLPALLTALEEVLTVYDTEATWAWSALGDTDDQWSDRLRVECGAEDLDDALTVVARRLNGVLDRAAKEGDADRARVELDEIVGRTR